MASDMQILTSGVVDYTDDKGMRGGMYSVIRELRYYYGQTRLNCPISILDQYSHLLREHDCDMLHLFGEGQENVRFRLSYDQIPGAHQLCSLSFLDLARSAIDPGWDLSDLADLEKLKSLSIYSLNHLKSIDLQSLASKLERLICQWKGRTFALDGLNNLRALQVHDFDERDFSSLAQTRSIERLGVVNSRIKSLDGLEALPNLTMLLINKARSLSDLSSILRMPRLEHVWFGSGIKNRDWNFLTRMPQLKSLHVEVADDISFIHALPNLEFFTLTKGNSNERTQSFLSHPGIARATTKPFPFMI